MRKLIKAVHDNLRFVFIQRQLCCCSIMIITTHQRSILQKNTVTEKQKPTNGTFVL